MSNETPLAPTSVAVESLEVRVARGRAFLLGLFARLEIEGRVEVEPTPEAIIGRVTVSGGAKAAAFADPKAPVWDAIAYLLRKVVNRELKGRLWVSLERTAALPAPGETTDEGLVRLGRELAERAVRLGTPIAIGPMRGVSRRWIATGVALVQGASCRNDPDPGPRRLTVTPASRAPDPQPGN